MSSTDCKIYKGKGALKLRITFKLRKKIDGFTFLVENIYEKQLFKCEVVVDDVEGRYIRQNIF